jgi:putative membrane-bound dehydrogenase-like protein
MDLRISMPGGIANHTCSNLEHNIFPELAVAAGWIGVESARRPAEKMEGSQPYAYPRKNFSFRGLDRGLISDRMNRTIFACPILIAAGVFGHAAGSAAKELSGVYQPTQNPCPSVEEAIKKMKVPDGYEVRNFAAEPMVINPVAMTWDHRGRLWVVELFEYPSGAKQPNEYSKLAADENFHPVVKADANSPRDRVVILDDTDNDGKADKRTVFAEGLNLATGVLCAYGGVFIGQAPNLFFFRDTDGDDKADEYKAVLTGFGLEDRHELLNSFCSGPDGCMYFTHGVFTHSKVRRPGEKDDQGNTLNAGVYRVKFTTDPSGKSENGPSAAFHEVYADGTSNPWGVDFDARGNAFVEACVIDHLYHMAPGGIYSRQGGAPENPYAYELLPSIVPKDHPKHFRAAYAGMQIYQGGMYPQDTCGHVFFGNIHDNAIHEEALEPAGATFKAKPVRDFLRANDGWFRPVSIQTGPDGFLWVMDWCDKYPCYQNAQANPEGVDREKGRIWRVCHTASDEGKAMAGKSRSEKDLNMAKLSSAALLQELTNSGNNWRSRFAAQLLQSRPTAEIEPGLRAILAEGKSWMAQKQALGLMAHHGLLRGKTPSIKNSDETGEMVLLAEAYAEALRATPPEDAAPLWKTFERLCGSAANPSAQAALATAIRRVSANRLTRDTLRDFGKPHPGPTQCIGELFNTFKNTSDRTLILRAWMAFEPLLAANPEHGLLALEYALQYPGSSSAGILTYKTARRLTDTRSAENMDLLLGFLDNIKKDDVLTAHALDGMLKAQEAGALKPAKYDPAPLFAHWKASKAEDVRSLAGRLATLWGDETAVADLIKLAEDENAPKDKREEAIRTLKKLKTPAARAALLRLLEKASQ